LAPIDEDMNQFGRKNFLLSYFIDGYSHELDGEFQNYLKVMTDKLESYYVWNDTHPFLSLASQNCSDMIIQAGMNQSII
jgi:hypothetical protein